MTRRPYHIRQIQLRSWRRRAQRFAAQGLTTRGTVRVKRSYPEWRGLSRREWDRRWHNRRNQERRRGPLQRAWLEFRATLKVEVPKIQWWHERAEEAA